MAIQHESGRKKSGFNYRVMFESGEFRVVEAFYNDAGEIYSYSKPASLGRKWDSLVALTAELESIRQAWTRPVITPADVTGTAPWDIQDESGQP